MIKGHSINSLGTISSFLQNMFHIQYSYLNFGMITQKIGYYKVRQLQNETENSY